MIHKCCCKDYNNYLGFNIEDLFSPETYASIFQFIEQQTGRGFSEDDWRKFIAEYEAKTGKKIYPGMSASEENKFVAFIKQRIAGVSKVQAVILLGTLGVLIYLLFKK